MPPKVGEVVKSKTWEKFPKAKKQTQLDILCEVWLRAQKENDPGTTLLVKPSMKQKGQLAHIVKRLDFDATKTLLAAVAADWEDFTYTVTQGKGHPPETPHMGFLLAHVEGAVNWFLSKQNKPAPKKSGGMKIPEF